MRHAACDARAGRASRLRDRKWRNGFVACCLQLRCVRRESRGARRRRVLPHHLTILRSLGRTTHYRSRVLLTNEHALLRRRHRRTIAYYVCGTCFFNGHYERALADATRACELILPYGRGRTLHALIAILDVRDVDVRDVDVRDIHVRNVHALDVSIARVIRGTIDLVRCEREPGDAAAIAVAAAAEVRAANEDHECGCVHGTAAHDARRPYPTLAHVGPATIVEGRKAPWRIIDPRPSVGLNPCPAAVTIRRPIVGNVRGHPDVSVVRVVAPRAVAIEILVTGHVARDVPRRHGLIFRAVARVGPLVVLIHRCRVAHVGRCAIGGEEHRLIRAHRNGIALRRDFGVAIARGNGARGAVAADVDAIGAVAHERHGAGGRIDLDVVIGFQRAEPDER